MFTGVDSVSDMCEGVFKSFRTGRLEFSATRCSCIAILRVSVVTFAAITFCVCCCKRIFRYRLSPETFGYTLV